MSSCCYIFINHLKYRILSSLRNCKKFYWPSSISQEAPHKRRIPITSAFSTAVMCYTVYTYVHGTIVATTAECLQNGFHATSAVSIALCTQCMKTLRVLMHHRCSTSRRLVARCIQRVRNRAREILHQVERERLALTEDSWHHSSWIRCYISINRLGCISH